MQLHTGYSTLITFHKSILFLKLLPLGGYENSFKSRQILSNAQEYFWKIHQMENSQRTYS